MTVTASLDGSPLPSATTVTVSRTGGTATSGTDYAAISSFTVTIASGQTSGTATLRFDPTDDSVYEGDETVILTGAASGLTSGTASLTIERRRNRTHHDLPLTQPRLRQRGRRRHRHDRHRFHQRLAAADRHHG